MNIYISHSSGYDYEKELYAPIKTSTLATTHHFFLPHEPENLDVDAVDQLKQTDILVAESSSPSTGQGIELGQAHVAKVPIICFYKDGSRPSSSLRFVTNKIIKYHDVRDLLEKLQFELDHIQKQSCNRLRRSAILLKHPVKDTGETLREDFGIKTLQLNASLFHVGK